MTYNMNQFKLTDRVGETMNVNPSTISARISKDEASYYVPGDCVKFVASEAGDAPVITKATDAAAVIDGVILFNNKKQKVYAFDMVEIGLPGTIVTMVAGTSFNRGPVNINITTGKLIGTSGAQIGRSLDIASADGDIVRVFIAPVKA